MPWTHRNCLALRHWAKPLPLPQGGPGSVVPCMLQSPQWAQAEGSLCLRPYIFWLLPLALDYFLPPFRFLSESLEQESSPHSVLLGNPTSRLRDCLLSPASYQPRPPDIRGSWPEGLMFPILPEKQTFISKAAKRWLSPILFICAFIYFWCVLSLECQCGC